MIDERNIVFHVSEGSDSHSIVYLHNGKVIVVVGSDRCDAIDKLQAQIAIEESKQER